MSDEHEKLRIDKWLWAARFFKTRSLAVEAVESGKVTMNEVRLKPAKAIGVGDHLDIRLGQYHFEIEVLGLPTGAAPRRKRRNSIARAIQARRGGRKSRLISKRCRNPHSRAGPQNATGARLNVSNPAPGARARIHGAISNDLLYPRLFSSPSYRRRPVSSLIKHTAKQATPWCSPTSWGILNHLDTDLRRYDVAFANGLFGFIPIT